MRTLSLILLVTGMAWGQTSVSPAGKGCDAWMNDKGQMMDSCAPPRENTDLEDVPAFRDKPVWSKPRSTDPDSLKGFREGCEETGHLYSATKGCRHIYWDCKDKKRILLESVDGSIHVCHKVSIPKPFKAENAIGTSDKSFVTTP